MDTSTSRFEIDSPLAVSRSSFTVEGIGNLGLKISEYVSYGFSYTDMSTVHSH